MGNYGTGEFDFTRKIGKSTVAKIWKEETKEKQPPISAYVIPHNEFQKTIRYMHPFMIDTSEQEYGKKLPLNKAVGTYFQEKNNRFVILHDEFARKNFRTTVRHEIRHIIRIRNKGR